MNESTPFFVNREFISPKEEELQVFDEAVARLLEAESSAMDSYAAIMRTAEDMPCLQPLTIGLAERRNKNIFDINVMISAVKCAKSDREVQP